ncbi:MAG: NAD-dependent epimerase/dehydratase family protein [Chloroflexota bacterium]
MKAVITGATGFVGSAVARQLAEDGIEVHALVLDGSNRERLDGYPITWHIGDITNPDLPEDLFAGADWVIHAAGMLGRAGVAEETYQRINAEGVRNVLAAVDRARLAGKTPETLRVLHVSSAGVLGPVRADAPQAQFNETAPLAPSNAYERSKARSEEYAQEFIAGGLPVVIMRPEFIYGPGDVHVLGLFRTIQRGIFFYIGDGQNTCHPTYIDDVVEGFRLGLERGKPGQIYHITGPRPMTFRELSETIADDLDVAQPRIRMPVPVAQVGAAVLETVGNATGLPVPLSRTGVAFFSESRRSTYARAAKELGYEPHIDLDEGIPRTIAWYRETGLLS